MAGLGEDRARHATGVCYLNTLMIPCPAGEVSDGFHTFNELYEHRHFLFLAFARVAPGYSWASTKHSDGSDTGPDWFVAGIGLPNGDITYHLPSRYWSDACQVVTEILPRAPEWDGHTSFDVLHRLRQFVNRPLNKGKLR